MLIARRPATFSAFRCPPLPSDLLPSAPRTSRHRRRRKRIRQSSVRSRARSGDVIRFDGVVVGEIIWRLRRRRHGYEHGDEIIGRRFRTKCPSTISSGPSLAPRTAQRNGKADLRQNATQGHFPLLTDGIRRSRGLGRSWLARTRRSSLIRSRVMFVLPAERCSIGELVPQRSRGAAGEGDSLPAPPLPRSCSAAFRHVAVASLVPRSWQPKQGHWKTSPAAAGAAAADWRSSRKGSSGISGGRNGPSKRRRIVFRSRSSRRAMRRRSSPAGGGCGRAKRSQKGWDCA